MKNTALALFCLSLCLNILNCPESGAENSKTGKSAGAQKTRAEKAEVMPWWKKAVFYEIYPRSFADARNCGTGNLAGITARLDYLKDLGIDAIWLTPCYPSPLVDFGYDISDYCNIAPEYGTLADFDRLVAEAGKRKIKILMDLVLNHTSDKHPWFVESRASKDNPKRDWYIWRDGKNGGPPNNWQALFGHSAWKLDPATNQYFYHLFYPEQPDLNWRNPVVRKAMYDVARFWLNRGAAGFRLDAVDALFEDPLLRDNPLIPGGKPNAFGDPAMEFKYNDHYPEVHDVFRDLRAVVDTYPDHPVLIGETSARDVSQLAQNYGKNHDEIQLPMNFFFATLNKLSAPEFAGQIKAAQEMSAHDWPVFFFSNHDQIRHYLRYGDGKHNDQIAKVTAALLLTLRGSPILYYGEELGMENNDPTRLEDVKDLIGKLGWPKEKGRDGVRTPMQWTGGKNAGFCQVDPWLPVGGNYKSHNVENEEKYPGSILNFYKSLIRLRRQNKAMTEGGLSLIESTSPQVLAYLRKVPGQSIVVCLNMSDRSQSVRLNLKAAGEKDRSLTTLLTSEKTGPLNPNPDKLALAPFSVFIARLQATPARKN
jgi:alpha-glucosidase